MAMNLLASLSQIQEGTVKFFQSFAGWGVIAIVVEVLMLFTLTFFVSKVLRDNDATKLMIAYWIILVLGGVLHLVATDVMDKTIFVLFILLVSSIMLIMFNTEIKKSVWDTHKADTFSSNKRSGGNSDIRTPEETLACITAINDAVNNMRKSKTGALIVLSKGNLPKAVLQSGTKIDAEISKQLIEGIFFPNSPLHDCAMVIHGHKIQAAGCFLPLTQKTSYPKEYGTRHRAAIGITEVANVISLVVSEETGIISIVKQGNVTRYADYEMLMNALRDDYYWQEMPLSDKKRNNSNWR